MIGYFPEIYEDEWMYSVLSRTYVHMGCYSKSDFLNRIFEIANPRKTSNASPLTCKIKDSVIDEVQLDHSVLLSHSLFGYYQVFLEDKTELNWTDNRYHSLWNLSYCPICVMKDRRRYGECYWHLSHQISGLNVCLVHGCRLNRISENALSSFKFLPLESVVDSMEIKVCDNEEQMFADYIKVMMGVSQERKRKFSAKKAFWILVKDTVYFDPETQQIKVFDLINRQRELFFDGIFSNAWQFRAWLGGRMEAPDCACKLLFLLGVDPEKIFDVGCCHQNYMLDYLSVSDFPRLKTMCLRNASMTDEIEYRLKYM